MSLLIKVIKNNTKFKEKKIPSKYRFEILFKLILSLTIVGPKELLKIVPGKDPTAKLAKSIPANVFSQKLYIDSLQTIFADETEKDE